MDSYKDQFDRGDWMVMDESGRVERVTPDPLGASLERALTQSAAWFIENTLHEHIMTELQLLAGVGVEIDPEEAARASVKYTIGKFEIQIRYKG